MPTAIENKRAMIERRRSGLEIERSSFLTHWRSLATFLFPRRPRFFVTDANKGNRLSTEIIDSTATKAADTLASGMYGGLTSPAVPWVRLTVSDPQLEENHAVRKWLDDVTREVLLVLAKSDVYDSLPMTYLDASVFATSPMLVEEDFERVLRTQVLPVGSYMLGKGKSGKIEICIRDFRMTVQELVAEFGMEYGEEEINWERFSNRVKTLWEGGNRDTWIDVCHYIGPNDDYDPDSLESKDKKYSSCYFERGGGGYSTSGSGESVAPVEDKYLREKGYDYFPILPFRWSLSGDDVYGTDCPGMTSLGDIKALQLMHKRKAQAIDRSIRPPLKGHANLKNERVSILPDDITYYEPTSAGSGLEPVYLLKPDITALTNDIREHQFRINQNFYVDIVLSLINPLSSDREMTAREVEERHDEKYMVFGKVLGRVMQDLLRPLIDITFDLMWNQGLIPEPPEELAGADVKVEFISPMAEAQKLVSLGGLERFVLFIKGLAEADPQSARAIWQKVNRDQLIDRYAVNSGLPAELIVPDEEVVKIREAEAKVQAAQMQADAIPGMAKAAKDLGTTPMEGDTALNRVVDAAKNGAAA